MRVPAKPPNINDTLALAATDPKRLLTVSEKVTGPLVSGKYLHWDKLRYYEPPDDLTHQEWWFGIKMHRHGQPVPLVDKSGEPFSFVLADPLPEHLHTMDFMTGGMIGMPEQVTNPDTRDSYIVRSLIEEAFTSSQLEGAASTREIAKELIRKNRKPRGRGEQMILNNYRAMKRIIELKDEALSKNLIFEIHSIVTENALDDMSAAGRFRREEEYRIVGDEYGVVFHEPPRCTELESRTEAMCAFANVEGDGRFIHPAIRSMILHFWLAYDHPFIDGNGRTARALFYWSMLRHGYWMFEFISISHAIIKSSTAYGRAFLHSETDGNDLTYFLLYHAAVIQRAMGELNLYIKHRSDELKTLEADLRGMAALNYRQRELISHAIRHPGRRYTVESHRVSHNVSRQTSNNDLLDLTRQGLLERIRAGREHFFVATPGLEKGLANPPTSP